MKSWKELKALPRPIWLLSLSTLVNRLGTLVLPFLMLYLTRTVGFSPEKAAAVLGVYGLVSLVVAPFAGALCDQVGPIRILEGGLLLSGITLLLFPWAKNFEQILAATFFFSLFNEASRPASMSLVPDYVGPELQKQAYALNRLAINLGMSISPVLGGLLAESDFKLIFFVDGITTLLSVLLLRLPGFRLPKTLPHPIQSQPEKPSFRTSRLWESLRDRTLLSYLIAILPVGIVFFQTNSTLPLYIVRDLGLSPSKFGALMAINTVMIVLFEVPLNSATSHWKLSRAMALGCLLFGVGFGAMTWVHSAWSIALTVVIWTMGEMLLFPAMSSYIANIAPAGKRGEYMGLFSTAFSVTFIAGPWLGTRILEGVGSAALWLSMLALGSLSALLMGRIKPQDEGLT